MTPISDETLDAFALKLIEDTAINAQIAQALLSSPKLRERYAMRQALLKEASAASEIEDPSSDFEARLWARIGPALQATSIQPTPSKRPRWLGVAALAAACLAAGLMIGLTMSKPSLAPVQMAQRKDPPPETLLDTDAADRILFARLAEHFEQAQLVLKEAQDKQQRPQVERLAEQVLELNRLYALAAQRAGHHQLASVLDELEPELVTLSRSKPDAPGSPATPTSGREELAFRVQVAEDAVRQLGRDSRFKQP
jgi:hypothetical protein